MYGRPWPLPLLVAIVALPGASAAMTLDLVPPAEPLAPESGTGPLGWTATIDCSDLAAGLGELEGDTTLSLAVVTTSAIELSGTTTHTVDTAPCTADPTGTVTASDELTIAITRSAPALTDLPLNATASLQRPATVEATQDPLTASAEATVQADVFFLMDAKVRQKIIDTSGGPVVFEVEVENFGNSPVDLQAELIDGPSSDAASWYQGADPLSLAWSGDGDASGTLEVVFDVPDAGARTNSQAAYSIALTPTYEGQSGDPVAFNVLIRHRGNVASQDAAGPGALLAVPALALTALALRRL